MTAPDETGGRPLVPKAYYSIGEVCDLTGLKPHVLRYWETQFRILQPSKNQAGNRVYRPREIKIILLLQHLLHKEKFTVEGARQRLERLRRDGDPADEAEGILASSFLDSLKNDLHELRDILTP
ncbi:MAG: MerR family transcriptional regulator [Gemmatimonadales bacterium]|nr:MAG: MerR family transcriptional regulator [Gemmatimonadales bacterium]